MRHRYILLMRFVTSDGRTYESVCFDTENEALAAIADDAYRAREYMAIIDGKKLSEHRDGHTLRGDDLDDAVHEFQFSRAADEAHERTLVAGGR